VILLVSFGIVMVYSASSTTGLLAGTGRSSYLVRHVVYAALGLGAMLLLRRVPFRRWRAVASPLMLVALVLVAATVTMGAEVNGARRWLVLGPIQFGPAEPAKLAMICFLASRLTGRAAPVGSVGAILRTAWPAVLPLVGLVALQPDQGTATVIVLTAGALIITAGARWGHALGIGAFALGLAGAYAWSADYRRERLLAFLDPFRDAHDSGYQIVQSLMAIGSGGLHGVGLGESVQKVFFLPEAHTDMIFAIIGEELGLIGMLGVIGAFVALAMIGFGVSRRCRDPFGALLAAGITTWFCGQAFVNVGSVTGSLPLTGVPLPFVSFGGTSLIALMAATGILMNIAATGPRAERPVPSEAGRTLGR
jgi:cell division protein FtsW